jgi:hypothetical protein
MSYYDSTINTIYGGSEIEAYVTDPLILYVKTVEANLDNAIQGALDKIVDESGGITYEPKPLNEISTAKPNTGDIVMNNKKITGLNTSIDFSAGIAGVASTAASILVSSIMHPNTGP